MRCIETSVEFVGKDEVADKELRCIETEALSAYPAGSRPIKSNMRCIETCYAAIGPIKERDKE